MIEYRDETDEFDAFERKGLFAIDDSEEFSDKLRLLLKNDLKVGGADLTTGYVHNKAKAYANALCTHSNRLQILWMPTELSLISAPGLLGDTAKIDIRDQFKVDVMMNGGEPRNLVDILFCAYVVNGERTNLVEGIRFGRKVSQLFPGFTPKKDTPCAYDPLLSFPSRPGQKDQYSHVMPVRMLSLEPERNARLREMAIQNIKKHVTVENPPGATTFHARVMAPNNPINISRNFGQKPSPEASATTWFMQPIFTPPKRLLDEKRIKALVEKTKDGALEVKDLVWQTLASAKNSGIFEKFAHQKHRHQGKLPDNAKVHAAIHEAGIAAGESLSQMLSELIQKATEGLSEEEIEALIARLNLSEKASNTCKQVFAELVSTAGISATEFLSEGGPFNRFRHGFELGFKGLESYAREIQPRRPQALKAGKSNDDSPPLINVTGPYLRLAIGVFAHNAGEGDFNIGIINPLAIYAFCHKTLERDIGLSVKSILPVYETTTLHDERVAGARPYCGIGVDGGNSDIKKLRNPKDRKGKPIDIQPILDNLTTAQTKEFTSGYVFPHSLSFAGQENKGEGKVLSPSFINKVRADSKLTLIVELGRMPSPEAATHIVSSLIKNIPLARLSGGQVSLRRTPAFVDAGALKGIRGYTLAPFDAEDAAADDRDVLDTFLRSHAFYKGQYLGERPLGFMRVGYETLNDNRIPIVRFGEPAEAVRAQGIYRLFSFAPFIGINEDVQVFEYQVFEHKGRKAFSVLPLEELE